MNEILLKISSPNVGFLDFYDGLAWQLVEKGKVFTPHPLIPPNARMAIPQPTEVIVSLNSVDALVIVHQNIQNYLVHNADREMTIEMEDDALTMTGRTFLDLNEFLDKIDAGLEPNSE